MTTSLVAALILAILSVVLALQNSAQTTLRFFMWEIHGPLALFLMGALAAGCAVGMLVMVPGMLRRSRALKRAQAERQSAERQNAAQAERQSAERQNAAPSQPQP